ncbi:ferredoxin--NADP+ reductase [Nocardioides panzhihuensis]|uniref:ferredoxin--NADP(+) reductase n=2 Tax=Nocardioides panzhihuensis TaxID=860243 RepID=A0A7Z0DH66_9ACTN|nr:ferredoxin--NADP+ reductase [Nocardioides panzhihuensis]
MLYIDPDACIDCGACVDVCPVEAVAPDFELEPEDEPFLALNGAWFAAPGRSDYPSTPPRQPGLTVERAAPLRVAVIGTGPSAGYVVESLCGVRDLAVDVTVIDRLLTPGGLARFGVAPDHPHTKSSGDAVIKALRRQGVTARLGVEVGVDVSIEELRATHHAVVLATGASEGRTLGLPGADLPGSVTAADLVGWYNGHPDHADLAPDLGVERAVVIGNGNVALDVARVLLTDPAELRRTDIAEHALAALDVSNVREVVVVGRRGPEHAAFTASELIGLASVRGLSLAARVEDLAPEVGEGDPVLAYKLDVLRSFGNSSGERRLELRFGLRPTEILGEDVVRGVRFESGEVIETELVVAAIGYRSRPMPGLPFDEARGVIPSRGGRVSGANGVYVSGWVKRGPSGGIGANRWCARETVEALLADFDAGMLTAPAGDERITGADLIAWERIDRHERALGRAAGRPRIKVVEVAEQRGLLG